MYTDVQNIVCFNTHSLCFLGRQPDGKSGKKAISNVVVKGIVLQTLNDSRRGELNTTI